MKDHGSAFNAKNLIPPSMSSTDTTAIAESLSQKNPAPETSGVLPNPKETTPALPSSGDDHLKISNDEFVEAVFTELPDGAYPAVCTKAGDPDKGGGWYATPAGGNLPETNNNYLNCSTFRPGDDRKFSTQKKQVAAYHFVLLDDLGTKVPLDKLGDFELSWLTETSPGNYQGGIILKEPLTDITVAERLEEMVRASGYSDNGASGLTRWARMPNAINGKEKHSRDGQPFQCRLAEWRPEKRYTADEIIDGLNLQHPAKASKPTSSSQIRRYSTEADDVFTPIANENPVLTALKERGIYKAEIEPGKHDITCPWVEEHTDELDTGAAYWEPNEQYPYGGFRCLHSHGDKYRLKEFLEKLELSYAQAMNRAIIRVVQGDIHRVVDVAERELARGGQHYQSGGLIVSISIDPSTGNPSIVPTNAPMLTRILSGTANWEKYDRRSNDWQRCDPPTRHVAILHDSRDYKHLPGLKGLARQPYFRELDGELVLKDGYDQTSGIYGVFNPSGFIVKNNPTVEDAQHAISELEGLLAEFRFASKTDKAAALSAFLTAAVRPTLSHAPAFHVRAPASGSGKSYLCELIGAFAGPAPNDKVSFPKSSEEATKVTLSLLMKNPAVIEFDDMDCDWLPHGVLNRALTAEHITDRVLGYSKTATVSTRTLFLGSGNNVGPVRDLMRRVLTINIDPKCTTPATIAYSGNPLDLVRENRGKYVSAALTIISAWKAAGSPRTDVEPIVTYSGAWSDYCRHPLIWLGLPDPATALLEQVKHDPDTDLLGALLKEWHKEFGSAPMTVRKILAHQEFHEDLIDVIREFHVEDRGGINRSKFGWMLKKNADRIVNGFVLKRAEADGRVAWQVVQADGPDFLPTLQS